MGWERGFVGLGGLGRVLRSVETIDNENLSLPTF